MAKTDKSIQQALDSRLAPLTLTDEGKARIRSAVLAEEAAAAEAPARKERVKKPLRLRKVAIAVCAACLTLVFGIGVAAEAFPGFEKLLEHLGDDFRGRMQPIGVVSVRQGIRMEVLAAVNDGENAVIYLSLTDEKHERIDENTELHYIDMGTDAMAHGQQVDYDAATGTAIYRLEAGRHQLSFSGQNVNLTLHSILTGRQSLTEIDTGLTVADLVAHNPAPEVAETQNEEEDALFYAGGASLTFGSNTALAEELDEKLNAGEIPVLAYESAPLALSAPDWIEITSAGLVDGLLHLQHRPKTDLARLFYTNFYLDAPGYGYDAEQVLSQGSISLGKQHTVGYYTYSQYTEDFFELPADVAAEDVRLLADATIYDEYIEGEWAVSFTLDESPPVRKAQEAIDLGDWVIEELEVTTIGIRAKGQVKQAPKQEAAMDAEMAADMAPTDGEAPLWAMPEVPTMELVMMDGSVLPITSSSCGSSQDGTMECGVQFSRPIDVAEVKALRVNGREVPLAPPTASTA